MVQNFASEIAQERVGDVWVQRFHDRYRNTLLYKWTTAMDLQRHHADSAEKYKQYFDLLHSKIAKYSIEPRHTYNMNEKGFAIGLVGRSKRFFSKAAWQKKRNRKSLQDGNREWVTVIAAICADGSVLSPGLVFSGQNNTIQSTWVADLDAENDPVFVTATPSGWSNDEVGLAWLEQVFDRETAKKTRKAWRLLILDGHGSHITKSFIEYCNTHRILLLIYPPHSTHTLQPLDVVCFSPLGTNYTKASTQLLHESQGLVGVKKSDFYRLFREAWSKTFTQNLILNAFETTGISPPDAAKVLNRFEKEPHESPRTPSPLTGNDWRQIERFCKQVVDDHTTFEARKLSRSLHYLSTQNQLLTLENKGLRRQVSKQKTSKKKRVKLPLQPAKEYYSSAVFWSPRKVREAQQRAQENHHKELEEAAAKARKKQERAEKKLQDEREKEQKRIERARKKEEEAQRKAAEQAQKKQPKSKRNAAKPIQLSQSSKRKASQKPPAKRTTKKRRVGGAVGSSSAAVRSPSPPPKLNSRGRKIALPKRFK